LIKTINVKAF
jgi:hypothetical protein